MRESGAGPSKLDIRREAARSFNEANEDFRQEFESIKPERDAAKLERLFRRVAGFRIGMERLLKASVEDAEPWFVREEGESAAELGAMEEVNGGLRKLLETAEEVGDEHKTVRKEDSAATEDGLSYIGLRLRKEAS